MVDEDGVEVSHQRVREEFAVRIGQCLPQQHREVVVMHPAHRDRVPAVRHFVALEGAATGWLDYEALLADSRAPFAPAQVEEHDLLTINYTSGTTSRPKGVMITHRNAYMNVVGTLLHVPMRMSDRYLWTLPMFHANGWTFVWSVTAVGAAHICLRKIDPVKVFELIRVERASMLPRKGAQPVGGWDFGFCLGTPGA